MFEILISALLILGLGFLFVKSLKNILSKDPTDIKAVFGKWFSFEATFQPKTSETRN